MRLALTAALCGTLSLAPMLAAADPAPSAAMRVSDLAVEVVRHAGTCEDKKAGPCAECEKNGCEGCQDRGETCACHHGAKKDADAR